MTWTACYSSPVAMHAYVVKGYLDQFGVPCLVDNSRFGMEPLTFGALGEVRVLVREDWLHVAEGLIRGRERDAVRRRRVAKREVE